MSDFMAATWCGSYVAAVGGKSSEQKEQEEEEGIKGWPLSHVGVCEKEGDEPRSAYRDGSKSLTRCCLRLFTDV